VNGGTGQLKTALWTQLALQESGPADVVTSGFDVSGVQVPVPNDPLPVKNDIQPTFCSAATSKSKPLLHVDTSPVTDDLAASKVRNALVGRVAVDVPAGAPEPL
jgi:hypothetical protein